MDISGRSKLKQKYLGCEAVLASQCTKATRETNYLPFFFNFFFSVHCSPSFLEVCVGTPDKKRSKSCWCSGDGVYGLSLLVLAARWVKWHRPERSCFLKVFSFVGIISATLHSLSNSNRENLDWFRSYLH